MALALAVSACVSPNSTIPSSTESSIAAQRVEVHRGIVEDALAREERVLRLSWPLITANEPLCRKSGPRLGWRLGDAKSVRNLAEGLNKEQIEAVGWDEQIRLLSVAPGSPADMAGLEPGMIITGIDDHDVASMKDLGKAFEDKWEDQESDFDPVVVRAKSGDEEITAEIVPVPTCDLSIVSAPSNAVNASASFGSMSIYAGLLRAVPDDNTIAFVIAHELAHWSGAHPRKVLQNASVTGSIIWGPVLMLSGQIVDIVAAPIAKGLGGEAPPFTTVTAQMASGSVGIASFEREADYVGAYMLARAGGDASAVAGIFQTFSNISPKNSWILVSHPTGPERQLQLQETAHEIARKQAAGEDLIPNGWTLRQPQ